MSRCFSGAPPSPPPPSAHDLMLEAETALNLAITRLQNREAETNGLAGAATTAEARTLYVRERTDIQRKIGILRMELATLRSVHDSSAFLGPLNLANRAQRAFFP